jgi:hypothetical protein
MLRKVTDPLVDLVLDTGIPWLWSLVSPILKSGWNATSPQISPIFEDSVFMNYMQDVSTKTEDLLGYAVAIVAKIDSPEDIVANSTTSNVNHFSEFLRAQNLTWLIKIIDRWNGFAYGNTPTDKIVCILCGYTVIIVLCAYYLAKTRNAYGATVGRAVQEALRQQGIVLKVYKNLMYLYYIVHKKIILIILLLFRLLSLLQLNWLFSRLYVVSYWIFPHYHYSQKLHHHHVWNFILNHLLRQHSFIGLLVPHLCSILRCLYLCVEKLCETALCGLFVTQMIHNFTL